MVKLANVGPYGESSNFFFFHVFHTTLQKPITRGKKNSKLKVN